MACLPLQDLPEHFVIKPCYGHSHRNVQVMVSGVDLLSLTPYTHEGLKRHLRDVWGRISRRPLLVEEFIRGETGEDKPPSEYKCYMFGGVIGAINAVERSAGGRDTRFRFYTPRWEPFDDQMNRIVHRSYYPEAPRCLDDILKAAMTLGRAYDTFVRVDLYASDHGCVFGEFAATPYRGRGFTPYANAYFGALWQEHLGDKT